MARAYLFLILGIVFNLHLWGQRDPVFNKIPFDNWLAEQNQPRFRFTLNLPRAELSFHQRLESRIEIKVDGRDLQSTRGNGQLMFFVQITASDGTRYQDHGSIDLSKVQENIKSADLGYLQSAFFLPGDYKVAAAILDTATGDHSARTTQFRVSTPRQPFLVDAWRNLPAIEFIALQQSPESWYLPDIQGQLQWASSIREPVRLNVILNVAAASNMAALLPTLKAISETGSPSISEQVELLDLARRHTVFHQENVQQLDWSNLKASLGQANTASIDLHSLSDRKHDAQFFVSEVRKVLRASEKPSVLIVLTNPIAFESGEDLSPISLESLPPCRVIYIRYEAPPTRPQIRGRGRRSMHGPIDQLEATLKPLHPKVFDVQTPAEITKALDQIR